MKARSAALLQTARDTVTAANSPVYPERFLPTLPRPFPPGVPKLESSATTDALWQARALRPNVVLVDLMLGSESGFDLAQHLDETDSDHPAVILISPHAEADFADLIKELPVAGFMAKSNPLARAIRQLMPG